MQLIAIELNLLSAGTDVCFPVYDQLNRTVRLTGKRIDDTAYVSSAIGIGVGRKDCQFGHKSVPACGNFGNCKGAQDRGGHLSGIGSVFGPGSLGCAKLSEQGSGPHFEGFCKLRGLAGKHFLEELMDN